MSPKGRAQLWLAQRGILAATLTPVSGFSNHVFLVGQSNEDYPRRSVLRLADFALPAGLCPLADDFKRVVARHKAAARLGLAPEVIASDEAAGLMWLCFAGKPTLPETHDLPEIWNLLHRLHQSERNAWGDETVMQPVIDLEGFLIDLRYQLQQSDCNLLNEHDAHDLLEKLTQVQYLGYEHGYFAYPHVPVHSDLNPGNCLHDGERWWLIDWDFSGLQAREWDLAGLIVEHDWRQKYDDVLVNNVDHDALLWFCVCFALSAWYWHQLRGSGPRLSEQQWQRLRYWLTLMVKRR